MKKTAATMALAALLAAPALSAQTANIDKIKKLDELNATRLISPGYKIEMQIMEGPFLLYLHRIGSFVATCLDRDYEQGIYSENGICYFDAEGDGTVEKMATGKIPLADLITAARTGESPLEAMEFKDVPPDSSAEANKTVGEVLDSFIDKY